MTGLSTFEPLDSVLVRYAEDPALLHWRGILSPVTTPQDPAHLRERYLVISPDRDIFVCNLADRARHTIVRKWDRGLQTLPHPLRAECNLDLDGPGGRYTRRLFEQRVRASVHEVAAAREELGLEAYPPWVTGLQFFGSANLPPPAEAVNASAFAFNPGRVWITVVQPTSWHRGSRFFRDICSSALTPMGS